MTNRDMLLYWLVRGIAAHDLYHAGQIQLLKRIHGGLKRRAGARPGAR